MIQNLGVIQLGAAAVALAYRTQMVEEVPMCPYDKPVDIIVTPDSMYYCSLRGQQLQPSD